MGVFAEYEDRNYRYRFAGTLHAESIAGGVPMNREVLEGHLRRVAGENVAESEILALATAIIQERDIDETTALNEAASQYARERSLVGFRVDDRGLWIPGNNLKACIKEAVGIAVNAGRLPEGRVWGEGNSKKAARAWFPEHIFVTEYRLYLKRAGEHISRADEVATSFPAVRGPGGAPMRAIKYTEVCYDVDLDFTLGFDWPISYDEWGAIWTGAQKTGIGAQRSQFGRFEVTHFDALGEKIPVSVRRETKKTAGPKKSAV